MLFSEVTGHKKIKDVLIQAVKSGHVGHAYIFEGPSGVGKLDLAKAFAMSLLCTAAENGCACGACKDCSQCLSGNHPDVQIVTNQLYDSSKKSTDILVDTVRNMKREIYIKPYSAERKVYIVPKADTMNVFAQNSLLKVLEEPPEYCTIILLAENSNMFLPTILSRAPIIKFFPLSETEVVEYLEKAHPDVPEESVKTAARLSGGSIRRAVEVIENADVEELRSKVFDYVGALVGRRRKSIYYLALFMKQNKDEAELIMNVFQEMFRDLMLVKTTGSCVGITNADKKIQIEKLAASISGKTPGRLLEILFKYSDYISKNISFAQISQCIGLELWEAIND